MIAVAQLSSIVQAPKAASASSCVEIIAAAATVSE